MDGRNEPKTLLDFKNKNSLNIIQMEGANISWGDVEERVKAVEDDGKPYLTVPGKLRGPAMLVEM